LLPNDELFVQTIKTEQQYFCFRVIFTMMTTEQQQDRQQQDRQQKQQASASPPTPLPLLSSSSLLLLDTLPNEAIGLIIQHACSDLGMLRSMSAVVGLYCELRVL
jgi:hypothetical protein